MLQPIDCKRLQSCTSHQSQPACLSSVTGSGWQCPPAVTVPACCVPCAFHQPSGGPHWWHPAPYAGGPHHTGVLDGERDQEQHVSQSQGPLLQCQAILQQEEPCIEVRTAQSEVLGGDSRSMLWQYKLPEGCHRVSNKIGMVSHHSSRTPAVAHVTGGWMTSAFTGCRYTTAASFLTMMSSLVGRDPAVFLQAVARTCALEISGGETMVRLRTAREQQQQQSAAPSTAASRDASAGGAPPTSEAAAPAGAVAAGPPATPPAGSRSTLAPDSTGAAVPAPNNVAGPADRVVSKSSLRSSRKLVPASFVEVVDALLDVVLSYKLVKPTSQPVLQQQQQGRSSDTAAMDVDAAATRANQQTPAAHATASDASVKAAAVASLDVTPLPTDLLLRKLNPVARETSIQTMVLRLLADYCLLYNNTVGLLLKRDTDSSLSDVRAFSQQHHHQATPGLQQAAGQEVSKSAGKSKRHSNSGGSHSGTGRLSVPGSSSAGAAGHDPPKAGVVLRQIMHVQLVDSAPEGTQSSASVASNASALLQAVCIRSGEGRRRIMTEVVSTLTAGADLIAKEGGSNAGAVNADPKLPYVSQQGGPESVKVSDVSNMCYDLVTSMPGG